MMITLLAGLQSVPAELYEAAEMDGAGFRHTLTGITLPLIKPISFISTILTFLWTFNTFENIWLLTGGGPNGYTYTLPILSYYTAFLRQKYILCVRHCGGYDSCTFAYKSGIF